MKRNSFDLQYLLPAIVHINHQPFLERGDGPIVSNDMLSVCVCVCVSFSTGLSRGFRVFFLSVEVV